MNCITSTCRDHAVLASVRFSTRARRMRLVVSPARGLELVAPPETAPDAMRVFLSRHAEWARQALQRLGAPVDPRAVVPPALPMIVVLPAIGETWWLRYRHEPCLRRTVLFGAWGPPGEIPLTLRHPAAIPDAGDVVELLRERLRLRAKQCLSPWVDVLVHETGLPAPDRLRVGVQRTVWGSRSHRGTLSLSARLLFLPSSLVRHVILHELCHARHMHHRAAFHRLLDRHDPEARAHSRELRQAQKTLPEWCA